MGSVLVYANVDVMSVSVVEGVAEIRGTDQLSHFQGVGEARKYDKYDHKNFV